MINSIHTSILNYSTHDYSTPPAHHNNSIAVLKHFSEVPKISLTFLVEFLKQGYYSQSVVCACTIDKLRELNTAFNHIRQLNAGTIIM
jgi:hypothetical protein